MALSSTTLEVLRMQYDAARERYLRELEYVQGDVNTLRRLKRPDVSALHNLATSISRAVSYAEQIKTMQEWLEVGDE